MQKKLVIKSMRELQNNLKKTNKRQHNSYDSYTKTAKFFFSFSKFG